VKLTVPATALRRWSDGKNDYAIPSGKWNIGAGAASDDIRQEFQINL
jgi:hypothetical protein